MEPVKYSYSRDEMIKAVKDHCKEIYGPLSVCEDKDKWNERFGAILNFVLDQFPK